MRPFDRSALLLWIGLSSAGGFLTFLEIWLTNRLPVFSSVAASYAIFIGMSALSGTLIGFGDWLVLRKRIARPELWWGVTALTWAALHLIDPKAGLNSCALKLSRLLFRNLFLNHFDLSVAIGWFMIGAIMGIGQWIVLRESAQRAGLWVASSSAAYGIAASILLPFVTRIGIPSYAIAGAIVGIISGVSLFFLLNPRLARASEST